MKKWVVMSLVLMFALSFAGSGFAAANAYDDVPAKHWAYDAVKKLERDGILPSGGEHSYQGDRVITRYEMAMIVANAMGKIDSGTVEDKLLIHNLEIEFSAELNTLGLHVMALEKKANKLILAPSIFYRYEYYKTKNGYPQNVHLQDPQYGGKTGTYRDDAIIVPFDTFYKINDDWMFWHQMEWQRCFWDTDALIETSSSQLKIANVSGKIGATTVTVGKFITNTASSLVFSDLLTGVQVAFGDKTNLALNVGSVDQFVGSHSTGVFAVNSPRYMNYVTTYHLDKDTTVKGGGTRVYTSDGSEAGHNYFDGSIERNLSDKLTLFLGYTKSNYSTDNLGYMVQLSPPGHGPDWMKVGDLYWWLDIGRVDINANILPKGIYNNTHGARGFEIGINYILMPKTIVTIFYDGMKATVAGDNWEQKYIRFQIQYFM
ncbi:MAG: S-layer protein [Firmicutes bacterium]|nr:S-layer protein [Bacillota bacterium]